MEDNNIVVIEKPVVTITELQIKQSIRKCFEVNTDWKPNDQLVLILFKMLRATIIDGTKNIFLKAPTGSGKSIVGFAFSWCWNYLHKNSSTRQEEESQAYFLTSSKALQSQLQGDIDRFQLSDVKMLKGSVNYECIGSTIETGIYHNYKERGCKSKKLYELELLSCYDTCPYLNARFDASVAGVSILNYWYFLSSVRRIKMLKDADGFDTDEIDGDARPPLFEVRPLTICDEAHLISDIIIGMYNLTLTVDTIMKIRNKVETIKSNFSQFLEVGMLGKMESLVNEIYSYFLNDSITIDEVYIYEMKMNALNLLLFQSKELIGDMMPKDALIDENENNKGQTNSDYLESLSKRPEDLLIESCYHGQFGTHTIYKHTIYDMDESMLARRYFLSRIDVGIFMSATLPPFTEYAYMMGISKNDYVGFEMENGFDFSTSPVHLQVSGYLNHKSFKRNIDNVLYDSLSLAESLENRNLKGIIHTATFEIARRLKEIIDTNQFPLNNKNRYLFYNNSQEKEAILSKIKYESENWIIAGPSLYEGIDLKDSLGRINILVKVPYSAITEYAKEKMIRFPFWYQRQTINKIEQSIGRTNRHIKDWSKTYLMDSCFSDIIFETDEHIVKRLKKGINV
jgi:Rad3-related DNA helicase